METIECIEGRRSRRKFLSKDVSASIIRRLLACAANAPSSVDCQPWHFIIVRDNEKKRKLAELKDKDNQQHILTAPISIIVCVNTEKSPSRWIEDGVTATENILLAAHDLGLGSVYVTGFKLSEPKVAEMIREIFNMPKKIMPITVLPIGYPDPSEKLDEKQVLDINKVLHEDSW